jgi:hypothetical protein
MEDRVRWHPSYSARTWTWAVAAQMSVADRSCPLVPAACGPYVAQVGLFVPKPSIDVDCQRCIACDLGGTVHQRPLVSAAGGGDSYSLGYSCTTRLAGHPLLAKYTQDFHMATGGSPVRSKTAVLGFVVVSDGDRARATGARTVSRQILTLTFSSQKPPGVAAELACALACPGARPTPSGRPQAQLISAIQGDAYEVDPVFHGYKLRRRGGCICCLSRRNSDPGGAARAPVHVQTASQIAGQISWSDLPRNLSVEVPPR